MSWLLQVWAVVLGSGTSWELVSNAESQARAQPCSQALLTGERCPVAQSLFIPLSLFFFSIPQPFLTRGFLKKH